MNSRTTSIRWIAIAVVVALGIVGVGCRTGPGDDAGTTSTLEPTTPTPTSTLEPATPTPTPPSTATMEPEPAPTDTATPFPATSQDPEALMYLLMQAGTAGDIAVGDAVIAPILAAGDRSFLAVFIDLLRIPVDQTSYNFNVSVVLPALQQLSGQAIGYDLKRWGEWLGRQAEVTTPPGYVRWKGVALSRLDRRFAAFFAKRETNASLPDSKVKLDVTQINWGGVLKDDGSGQSIPSLVNPAMTAPEEATYLVEGDRVFGVSINGDHRAYPLRIMNWHEMANDIVGGQPVALAYCTLCGAGILFDTTVDDSFYIFRTSGLLYISNKLMYDLDTNTLWNQFTGEPVLGELADSDIRLKVLPIMLTTWGEWLAEHPDTVVLDIDTGYSRDYSSEGEPGAAYNDYFSSLDTYFSVPDRDDRLETKALVYGLELYGETRAYPIETMQEVPVVNDTLGGVEVVLVAEQGTNGVRVYQREGLTFALDLEDSRGNTILDEDGTAWSLSEEALINASDPEMQLNRIGGHVAFWFGWYAFHPETTIYGQTP